MAGSIRVTTAGAYVEINGEQWVRVTTVGAYVEERGIAWVRVSTMGAYVELSPTPEVCYGQIISKQSVSGYTR